MTRWGFAADWPAPPGVRVLSTFRGTTGGASGARGHSIGRYASLNLGAHVGDDPVAVAANRRELKIAASLPAEPSWLNQVHGVSVKDLDAPGSANALHAAHAAVAADGAVTRRAGVVCAILTADCLPIVLAAECGEAVAAAHGGWRGLAAGVIGATVRSMRTPPERLLAWLGPAIGPEHFEVGAEVRAAFLAGDPGAGRAFRSNRSGGRFMADLALLARRQLSSLGIERIYGGGECTYTDSERYFSFRRDGVTGRQATLIWRER